MSKDEKYGLLQGPTLHSQVEGLSPEQKIAGFPPDESKLSLEVNGSVEDFVKKMNDLTPEAIAAALVKSKQAGRDINYERMCLLDTISLLGFILLPTVTGTDLLTARLIGLCGKGGLLVSQKPYELCPMSGNETDDEIQLRKMYVKKSDNDNLQYAFFSTEDKSVKRGIIPRNKLSKKLWKLLEIENFGKEEKHKKLINKILKISSNKPDTASKKEDVLVSSPSIIDPWNSLTYIKYSLATSISHGGGITFQYNRKLQNEIISKEEPARFQSLMTGGFLKRVTNFKAPFSSHIHLYNPEKGVNEDKALVTAPLSLFNTAHFVQHRHHVAAGIPFLTGKVSAGDGSHGCFLGIKTEPTPSTNDYGAVTFGLETSAFGKTGPDGHTHNVFATSASNNLFLTAGKIDKVVAQIFEDNKQLKEKRGSLRVDLTHSKDAKWILATDDDMRLKRHAVGMLLGMDDAVSEEQYQQIFSSYRDFFNDKVFKYHGAPRNWQDFNKLCESAQAQITKAKDEQGSIDETKPRSLSDSSSGSTSSEGSNEEKESKNSVASSDSETARSISQNSPSTATPTVPHQRENLVPHETFKISSYGELLHLTLQSELELTIYEQLGGGEDHRNEQELYQRLVREMPRKLVQKEDANFESCYAKILKISDTKIRMYLLQDLIRICAKTKEVKHSQQDEIKNPLGELLRLANNSQWDTQGKKCGISFFPSKTPTAILDIRKFNPGKDTYENLISKIHSQMQSKWSTFGRSEQTKAYYELIMSAYFVLRRSHIDKAAIASAIEEITRNFSKQFQLDSSTSVSAPSSTLPLA